MLLLAVRNTGVSARREQASGCRLGPLPSLHPARRDDDADHRYLLRSWLRQHLQLQPEFFSSIPDDAVLLPAVGQASPSRAIGGAKAINEFRDTRMALLCLNMPRAAGLYQFSKRSPRVGNQAVRVTERSDPRGRLAHNGELRVRRSGNARRGLLPPTGSGARNRVSQIPRSSPRCNRHPSPIGGQLSPIALGVPVQQRVLILG